MTEHNSFVEPDRGSVFLIQSFSTSDGPGIRSTVFLKGCPLSCKWCQNPESKNIRPELMTHDDRCIGCGECVNACKAQAITLEVHDGQIIKRKIARDRCNRCFDCVSVCPADALTRIGEYMSVDQVLTEIDKDSLFIQRSGGGVTLSGGEPLHQAAFAINLLKTCKERGFHTALDTSGYAPWPLIEKAVKCADLVLYDIKPVQTTIHLESTGVDNSSILSNVRKIKHHTTLWLRIPLIPGYTDTQENLDQVILLGRETGAEKISLLPFNRFGDGKYRNLGLAVPLPDVAPLSPEKLKDIMTYMETSGFQVALGE